MSFDIAAGPDPGGLTCKGVPAMPVLSGFGFVRGGPTRTLKASAAETANTTHATVETGRAATATVTVDVTATGGSPTLVVVVEGSNDGSTWVELGRIGANGYRAGTTGTAPSSFAGTGATSGVFPAPRLVRTRSVVGGTTPSFTYSVTADLV